MQQSSKVSIIGAGMVGATLAQRVLESGIADVALVDILKDIAEGKALDMADAAPLAGHERTIAGTDDYRAIESSDVVVITAGLPRKPGMTREDLVVKNASIVKAVSEEVRRRAPQAVVIVVTNPLDTMTYLAYKTTGFDRRKVFGMAGALDGSRFVNLLAEELKVPRSSVKTTILGSHGDTMVPVLSKTTVSGRPVSELLAPEVLEGLLKRVRNRGAQIVKLLGSGSAYYSPSMAAFRMVETVLKDGKETMVASVCLEGEYGLKDLCIGVPCLIGRNGIEKVIELELSKEEAKSFFKSAQAIKGTIGLL